MSNNWQDKYKFIGSVYLLLIRNQQILLLKRQNTNYQDRNFGLVSGHMDGGETIKQAMIREAQEEANIVIEEKDLQIATFLHRLLKGKPERFDFFLTCQNWTGEIINAEPDKHSEISWHNLDNLPENIVPEVKKAIENYRAGVVFDDLTF